MRYGFLYKAILFLLLTSHCLAHQANQALLLTNGLDAHIAQSRDSFEAIYYQMVEKGLFPLSYNNNLIINSGLHPDVQKEGVIILKLIEWLEKQDDYNCSLLLEKINNLYFLQLHSFLCKMDLKNDSEAKMLAFCQDLYHCIVPVKSHSNEGNAVKEKAPFRSGLSKLFLMISIINESELHYEERKETLAFALEGIKREMLIANQALGCDKIDNDVIKSFVTLLEGYAASEPMIESHMVLKIIIVTIVIAVIGLLIYKYVIPNRSEIWKKINKWAIELRDAVLEPLGEGVARGAAKGVVKELDKPENQAKLKQVTENATRSLLHGIATDALAGDGQAQQPNPDLTIIGEKISESLYDGIMKGLDKEENQAKIKKATEDATRAMFHGIATNAPVGDGEQAQQPNPDLTIIGEKISESLYEGVMKGLDKPENQAKINKAAKDASRSLLRGLATNAPVDGADDQNPQPNPDLTIIGEQISKALYGGVAKELDKPENQAKIKNATENATRLLIRGIATNAPVGDDEQAPQPNQDLAIIGEKLSQGLYDGVAKELDKPENQAKFKKLEDESGQWRGMLLNVANKITKLNETVDELQKTVDTESPGWRNSVDEINKTVNNIKIPYYGRIVQSEQKKPQQDNAEPQNDNNESDNGSWTIWGRKL